MNPSTGLVVPGLGGRPAFTWPFPDHRATGSSPPVSFPNSIWTTPLPMSPVIHPASPTIVSNFANSNAITLAFSRGASRYISSVNNPSMTVHVNPPARSWDSSPVGTIQVPFPRNLLLRPSQWTTDHETVILVPDANGGQGYAYGFWVYASTADHADPSGGFPPNQDGSWTCNTFQISPMDGTYSGVGLWAGDPTGLGTTTSASGAPYEAATLTIADLLSVANGGSIDHMLSCAVTQTGASMWPATNYDGTWAGGNPGSVPEGTILTWAPGAVKPSNMSALGSAQWDAISNFGLFVDDTTAGNGTALGAENPSTWWQYAPGNPWQPYLPGLLDWANNEDNAGKSVLPAAMFAQPMQVITPTQPSGRINGTSLPTAPSGLTATTSGGTINLSWSAPSSFGGGSAVGYYVFCGTATGSYAPMGYNGNNGGQGGTGAGVMAATCPVGTTTLAPTRDCFFNLFVNGTRYFFVVCALSSAGMGPASNEASAVAA